MYVLLLLKMYKSWNKNPSREYDIEAAALRCRHHPGGEDAVQEASPAARPAQDGQ